MNCAEIRELLPLYIDHMLEDNQMIAIEDHLSSCDACTQEHEELLQMLSLLSTIDDVPLPEEFDLRLHEALKKEVEEQENLVVVPIKKNQWKKWSKISSIAAVFVVGLFTVFLYNNVNGFNFESLINSAGAANISDQAYKTVAPDSAALKKSVAISDEETASADVNSSSQEQKYKSNGKAEQPESDKTAPQTTLAAKQTPSEDSNTSSQSGTSDQNADSSQASLKATMTTERAAVPSTGSATQIANDESQVKSSYNYSDGFNPSRFLETLSAEDAQIYKELLNSNIYLSSGRDSNAVIYYVKQMKRVLGTDCTYKFISCTQEPEGIWNIQISITTKDENGNDIQEVVTYCGQDGELWKKELS